MTSTITIPELSITQMSKMLRNLQGWLGKAEAYAKERGFDVDVLVGVRLAPDQFSLARQIQASCDTVKFAAARLSGGEAPPHPDEETSIAQLRQRILATLAYLETVTHASLEGAAERDIQLPFAKGKACKGSDYLVEFVVPNFYFHVTTAYALLRHSGVPLGKLDFIGGVKMYDFEG